MKIKKIKSILGDLYELILSEVFYNTEWDFEDLMDEEDSENLTSQDDYLTAINIIRKKIHKDIFNSNSITLPESNMTNGKYRDGRPTQQFCVIPNTEGNKKAIKHWNKLATEQNSRYRFKTRYRCPKEGVSYGTYGGVDAKDAEGLGVYIDDVKANYNSTINDRLRRENMELKRALNDMERIINNTRKED